MSHNEHPLPTLGNAEIPAVKHLPLRIVPQLIKRGDDRAEGSAFVVKEKALNVLKQTKARPLAGKDASDLEEESSSSIFETQSSPGDRERLARKAADQEVKVR
jgi:hypothetical protein